MKTLILLSMIICSCGQPSEEGAVIHPTIITNSPGVEELNCEIGEVDTATGVKPLTCTYTNRLGSFIEEGY